MKRKKPTTRAGQRKESKKQAADNKIKALEARASKLASQLLQEEPGVENSRREIREQLKLEGRAVRQQWVDLEAVKPVALSATLGVLATEGARPRDINDAVANVIKMNGQQMEQEKRELGSDLQRHLHLNITGNMEQVDGGFTGISQSDIVAGLAELLAAFGSGEAGADRCPSPLVDGRLLDQARPGDGDPGPVAEEPAA